MTVENVCILIVSLTGLVLTHKERKQNGLFSTQTGNTKWFGLDCLTYESQTGMLFWTQTD